MKSSAPLILAAATIAFLSTTVNAADSAPPDYKETMKDTYIGCFKSAGGLTAQSGKENYQSAGLCQKKCTELGKRYSGLTKKFYCYCGDTLPSESDQVSNDVCNLNCAGYPQDPCGSNSGDYTIFLTDPADVEDRLYDPNKPLPSASSSSSTSSSSSVATSTVTQQETTIVSQTPTESSDPSPKKSEPSGINKAGAAAGAVVGVLVAVAIGVGAFLFIRKQRRKKLEEEYRRSLAVREFHKKPETDLRLDPVMLQRRMSDGSIADNQDYSRRILKVTNPDGM
ncbi:WSC domain-containing protein [Tirmania nivea]|nr:WSC domain-containing protein [Tirmania nivea]